MYIGRLLLPLRMSEMDPNHQMHEHGNLTLLSRHACQEINGKGCLGQCRVIGSELLTLTGVPMGEKSVCTTNHFPFHVGPLAVT